VGLFRVLRGPGRVAVGGQEPECLGVGMRHGLWQALDQGHGEPKAWDPHVVVGADDPQKVGQRQGVRVEDPGRRPSGLPPLGVPGP